MSMQLIENHTYIDGHKIAFLEQGQGTPVLLLHGIPTNSRMWRAIIPKLAEKHRVIAPDLLNYGQSENPETADVSINAQSRIIAQFMNSLGIPRADVVAHDIGGGVAQLLAVNYPEKIANLALIDSVCFDSWPIPEFEPLQKPEAESQMNLDEFISMMRNFMPNGVENKSVMNQELIDLYINPWSSEEGKRAFFRNLRRLNPEYTQAIAEQLSELPHPTLIMWGENDPFQKPKYAEKLATAIPNAKLAWIKGTGHWLIDEKPDEVARELIDFLNSSHPN